MESDSAVLSLLLERVDFEIYTGRRLHGFIEYIDSSRPAHYIPKGIDKAAIHLTTVNLDHFYSRDDMDQAIFELARPAGLIKTLNRVSVGEGGNLWHYQIGYATTDCARRAFTLLHMKDYNTQLTASRKSYRGPLNVKPRLFERDETWLCLPLAEYRGYHYIGRHAITRARSLESTSSVQTDSTIPLGPDILVTSFSELRRRGAANGSSLSGPVRSPVVSHGQARVTPYSAPVRPSDRASTSIGNELQQGETPTAKPDQPMPQGQYHSLRIDRNRRSRPGTDARTSNNPNAADRRTASSLGPLVADLALDRSFAGVELFPESMPARSDTYQSCPDLGSSQPPRSLLDRLNMEDPPRLLDHTQHDYVQGESSMANTDRLIDSASHTSVHRFIPVDSWAPAQASQPSRGKSGP